MLSLGLYIVCRTSSLEKTILAPLAPEAIWNHREIRNPDQSTQEPSLRCIEETCTFHCVPVCRIQGIMRFKLGRIVTGEVRVDQERTLGDIDLLPS